MSIDPAEAAARKKRRHRNERIVAAVIVLIAAIVTARMVWFKYTEEQAVLRDTRYVPKPDRITPDVELLQQYVRIDTTEAPGIAQGARWLAAELAKRGVRAELIESTPGHLNVYARIKGRQPGGALMLLNHIDIVAPGEGWSQEPFGGKVHFNELYGRGALDMKSLAICQMLAFAEIARSGRPPEHDLVFLATAEEERGSTNGLVWLLEHRPDLFEGVELALNEGGLAETMSEKVTYFGIEVGGKQRVIVMLQATDEEPLRQARFKLQRYVARRDADRVLPAVRQYFKDIAPTRVANAPYLADIDGAIARGEFWHLPFSYREFVQNSVRITAPYPEGSLWWGMHTVLLNLPDVDPDERLAWLRDQVAPYGVRVGDVLTKEGPVPLSSSDTRLFRILAAQARRQYQTHAGVQVLYQSVTDCRFLRQRNVTCYGISPFPVSIFQASTIHNPNERIRLDWFGQGVTYVREVVKAWAWPSGQ